VLIPAKANDSIDKNAREIDMILGMTTFTAVHVLISLIGIASGLLVLNGLCRNRALDGWTAVFLAATLATSVTGFFFPYHGFTPALGVAAISVVLLCVAIVARYGRHLHGQWRWLYVVGAVAALYLNSFVLVVQSFLKVPALHSLAPTGSGPVFAIVQAIVLAFFVVTGILAAKRFHPAAPFGAS
jgi:hypothetical protein